MNNRNRPTTKKTKTVFAIKDTDNENNKVRFVEIVETRINKQDNVTPNNITNARVNEVFISYETLRP